MQRYGNQKKIKTYINEIDKSKKMQESLNAYYPLATETSKETAMETLKVFQEVLDQVSELSPQLCSIVDKAVEVPGYETKFSGFLDELEQWYDQKSDIDAIYLDYDISIADELYTNEVQAEFKKILEEDKPTPFKGIGTLFNKTRKSVQNGIQINNVKIETLEQVVAVHKVFQHKYEYLRLSNDYNRLMDIANLDNDAFGTTFETQLYKAAPQIRRILMWPTEAVKIVESNLSKIIDKTKIEEASRELSVCSTIEQISQCLSNNYIQSIEVFLAKAKEQELITELGEYQDFINGYKDEAESIKSLVNAIRTKDVDLYEQHYVSLNELLKKENIYHHRKEILRRIALVAPNWSKAIEKRIGIHGHSEIGFKPEEAWKCLQLKQQLDILLEENQSELSERLRKIQDAMIQNGRLLAFEKARLKTVRNLTLEQTQSINAWSSIQKQIGKGTGKRAPQLRKEARDLMPKCQGAIPVWIMSVSKVIESFMPSKNKFDVIIIDEASQSDILALPVLYLAKQVIIVGDDEQVSPESVGVKSEEVQALSEQLIDDFDHKALFNERTSLYDLAKIMGFQQVMLLEHFRCLPDIISFSNGLSYMGRVRPLRDAHTAKLSKQVVPYRVADGVMNDQKVNHKEAMEITSLICACCEFDEYSGMTFGTIAMVGKKQSEYIDTLLQTYLSPHDYVDRKIQCGTSSHFQGDERDVIFVSLVQSPKEDGGPLRLVSAEGNNEIYRKKYNVAASRAKDQMWVVHSINPETDLKPDDLRLRLIKHAENPQATYDEATISKTESPFEREVCEHLMQNGFDVITQYKVGAYRIDMVIQYEKQKVAFECDGEKYHQDIEKDMQRQAVLERLGWTFIRLRGSEYYIDKKAAMKRVINDLHELGIYPQSTRAEETHENDDLIVRVKRRANELQNEWMLEKKSAIEPFTILEDSSTESA